jgi:hypothetical protein
MKLWTLYFPLAGLLLVSSAHAATFDGYQCQGDCSGHQAGFDWAEQNQITDDSSCSTPSNSFNEGCTSYIEGNSGGAQADDEDNDDDDDDDDDE